MKPMKNKGESKLERDLFLVIGVALIMMVAMSSYIDSLREKSEVIAEVENDYEGIIRFHVVAHSDTEEDQALKLKVRDYVMEKLQAALAGEIAAALEVEGSAGIQRETIVRTYMEEHMGLIQSWAEDAIREEGASYGIRTELGVTWIPEREYDGIYFPEGNYEALKIVIGDGQGENWWCVLFPPLCLIGDPASEEGEETEEENTLIFGEGIFLRSKILEILRGEESS